MSWKPEADEIAQRHRHAEALGGEESVRRHREGGKLTVRERIAQLTDPGSFQEVGKLAGQGSYTPDGVLQSVRPMPYVMGLAKIDGLARLRYSTSHPHDVDDALIEAHRDIPAVMPFVHLPVQSGSDRILEAMNRKHTAADYRRIVERFRHAREDIAFSSDFIVGFPGETEEDFAATLALVEQISYAAAYSFKYSPHREPRRRRCRRRSRHT